jgi:hypothetical protein
LTIFGSGRQSYLQSCLVISRAGPLLILPCACKQQSANI